MIISIVIVDHIRAGLHGKPPYFAALGAETALEHLVRTVVRGPFGVTIVAAIPEYSARARELLAGFAVQHIEAAPGHPLLADALKSGSEYRERWQRAMEAAKARFGNETDEPVKKPASRKAPKGSEKKDWSQLKSSPDVKVRGLARSFDRDGVIIFPADHPAISLELQAQMVEAFGREGADKGEAARPVTQAVHLGQRGYPVLLDSAGAKEAAALPANTQFDRWLLDQLPRIQDVPVQDPGAVSALRTEEDYENICRLLKIKTQL